MKKESILIVEDDFIIAKVIEKNLIDLGYAIAGLVATGEDALAKAGSEQPDLVLMDIHLQGEMDGIAASEKIHAALNIPVVFLTAFSDRQTFERALATAPYGYIVKPFHERELNATIEMALYKHVLDRKLQESEEKFREIFDAANDAIHLHEIDKRSLPGKFIDVNESACRMVQYSREELLEKSPLDLTTAYHSLPLEQIGEALTTKGSALFETEFRRKDGVIVPVEVNAHIVIIHGRKLGLSVIRDLTRRKRDEAAFRQLSADHKAIIDHAPAMIWYKDTKNTYLRVNPAGARAAGMSVEEIEGKSAYTLFPDRAEKYYQDDLEVMNSGKPKLGIIEPMITATGDHLWVQTDKIPLKDEQGTITGVLLFGVDITERKHAEDALALASRKLNLLSSISRHDILNQLTALKTYIELSKDMHDMEKLVNFISTEEKIADTLERQINFTREYQDLGATAPVWQNIHAGIEKAVAALPLRNISVKMDFTDCEVFADLLFEKVFYNLIDNALRYGGDTMTAIRISSHISEGCLVIVFEDDGVGISPEEKKHLFTRGFGKHTGLGLFLIREILSITGITITETGEPGNGARFEIVVPNGSYRIR